jgi:feruloyl esterase
VATSRFADQYDGFLAGAPGYNLPKAAIANIFGAQRYATVATNPADLSTAFTPAERATVATAVLAKCDALDGSTDGMVQDVEACRTAFNFKTDVPTCTGARDGTCLSAAQKTAIEPIFTGATTSTGTSFYASFPYDPGVAGSGIPFWEFVAPVALDTGGVGQIWKVPPEPVAGFNGPAFALNMNIDAALGWVNATDATYTESAMSFMTPPDPTNLATLKNRGAKIMVYHGVADPIFSVDDTKAWYTGLMAANGGDASNFARFYRVPGMATARAVPLPISSTCSRRWSPGWSRARCLKPWSPRRAAQAMRPPSTPMCRPAGLPAAPARCVRIRRWPATTAAGTSRRQPASAASDARPMTV